MTLLRGITAPSRGARRLAVPSLHWRGAARWFQQPRVRRICGYSASISGVAVLTWLISLALPRYHVANISMIYLLLVLALAVFLGSGPAVLASVLAFLAFDWFFVTPVGRFTVDDPSEWLALFLFLVVAIITGQLAAGLRRRAEEARRRARELSILYALSTAILGDDRLEHILQVIAERLVTTLKLRNAAILLQDSTGALEVAAEAGVTLTEPARRDRELGARCAIGAGALVRRYGQQGSMRLTRALGDLRGKARANGDVLLDAFVPILLGSDTFGVVSVLGEPNGARLGREQQRLLYAFVAQAALAVGRARLAAEEARARAAAESERMKSVFLASVSHDLRTPLTAIKTAASGLRQEIESRSDLAHRELAVSIEGEVDRLDRLVGNLLEMSRIEAGTLPLRKQPEDLSEVLGTVVHRLASLLATRTLDIQIADDLPLISFDAVQIDRVLTNLLENAVKFSPPQSVITISVWQEGDSAFVCLHNAGPHLPDGELRRIFDRFYRLKDGGRGARGTGLGLAICKRIVEAHDGRIWAENDGDGIRFIVCLPCERGAVGQTVGDD